jgi:subtilisin family serine protease
MYPLDLVGLAKLMTLTDGKPEVAIGLIDGPVAITHPDFAASDISDISSKRIIACTKTDSYACKHGTFVAAILGGRRNSGAPGICPGCKLIIRPIFAEELQNDIPYTSPEDLATAIIECVDAGVKIINMSVALTQPTRPQPELEDALNYAMRSNVIVVTAAGNQGTVGSTAITRHPWQIPVAACNAQGRPIEISNFGRSVGRFGLMAPGENITSLGSHGKSLTMSGTSAAAPFVTGAIALLWSIFPTATATELKLALRPHRWQAAIVPPLLDAVAAYQSLLKVNSLGGV